MGVKLAQKSTDHWWLLSSTQSIRQPDDLFLLALQADQLPLLWRREVWVGPGCQSERTQQKDYKTQFSNYILLRDVLQRKARIPASPVALRNNQDCSKSKKDLAVVEFCKCCGMFGTSQLRSNRIKNVQLKIRTKHWGWKSEILYEGAETWCHKTLSQTLARWG